MREFHLFLQNMTAESEAGVFASCRFCLSPASSEDGSLAALIEANGGRVDNYLTDMSTHVIVEENVGDSELVSEARDLNEWRSKGGRRGGAPRALLIRAALGAQKTAYRRKISGHS